MISEKQAKILAFPYSKYDALVCDGAVRSGKTSIMTVAFVDWAMRCFNGCRFGICGKTVDSATKNIVIPYTQMAWAQERYSIKWRRSEKIMEVRRGNTVNIFEVFGGKDEASAALIQGRTLAGVLLDEVVLMPQSFVQQALTRCSVEGAKMWFSCNPASPKHWFYQEWILGREKHNALYLHFSMTDNPSLSEKTLARYKQDFSGVFYQRYVLGEWVMADGLVYQNFDEEKHTFTDTPFLRGDGTPMRGAEFWASCDYGINNPFSAHLWALYKGVAYCWREYYYDSKSVDQYGQQKPKKDDEGHYAALNAIIGDIPIEAIVIDPSATSFKETIRRHDKYDAWNANNDVIPGIATVSSLLNAGRMLVHKSCKNALDEFGLYSWDADAPEDRVIKEFDHAMDDIRYMCHTIVRREFDWLDWSGKDEKE